MNEGIVEGRKIRKKIGKNKWKEMEGSEWRESGKRDERQRQGTRERNKRRERERERETIIIIIIIIIIITIYTKSGYSKYI